MKSILTAAIAAAVLATSVHAQNAPAGDPGKGAAAPANAGPPSGAPPLNTAVTPTLQSALALAESALAACKTKGFAVSVSVVDSAGLAKVTLGADGSPGRTATSVRKAATAVAFNAPGSELEARAAKDKDFAAKIAANPDYNDHPGSLPLLLDGKLIGGIGIGGAPTHEDDEACARSAVTQLQGKMHAYTP
ncbi:MAG: heme-binding protein [Steroidobacteraceae bacterium]